MYSFSRSHRSGISAAKRVIRGMMRILVAIIALVFVLAVAYESKMVRPDLTASQLVVGGQRDHSLLVAGSIYESTDPIFGLLNDRNAGRSWSSSDGAGQIQENIRRWPSATMAQLDYRLFDPKQHALDDGWRVGATVENFSPAGSDYSVTFCKSTKRVDQAVIDGSESCAWWESYVLVGQYRVKVALFSQDGTSFTRHDFESLVSTLIERVVSTLDRVGG